MKAVIFGINGQDGFYLNRLLTKKNIEIIGIGRKDAILINDFISVADLIKREQPDYIFHLAAKSTTQHAALFENHETISTGTLNILEAVYRHSPHTRVFISGSGLQFKNENKPIKETDEFEGRDVYSIARIQSVYAARYYRSLGIKVYVGYFFNHDSPLRNEQHLTKKISESAKRIAKGIDEQLIIGDINVIKEYTFAGDIVAGVLQLIYQEDIFEANISSGLGYSIKNWLDECFSLVGLNWEKYVGNNPNYMSPYQKLVSDPTIIKSIGWQPFISFKELAKMMMNE
jgi:GDPmannose 4,6-dehydratase